MPLQSTIQGISAIEVRKEESFLDYLCECGLKKESITDNGGPAYHEILDTTSKDFDYIVWWNTIHKPSIISDYILETPLKSIPYKLMEALWKSIINEPTCSDAIYHFIDSIRDKKWILRISEDKWYYQKLSWWKTLIWLDWSFLLPSQLIKLLIQKIFNANKLSLKFDEIDQWILNEINTYTEWFFEVDVVGWIVVFFIKDKYIFNPIEDDHWIKINTRPTSQEGIRPKVVANLIYESMPKKTQEIIKGEFLASINHDARWLLLEIMQKKYSSLEIKTKILSLGKI